MRELKRTRQSDDERYVLAAQTALSFYFEVFLSRAGVARFKRRSRWEWSLRDSTREWRVVVYVILEQVEEAVVDKVDCAVYVLFNAEV